MKHRYNKWYTNMISAEQLDSIDLLLSMEGVTPIDGQVLGPWYGGAVYDPEVPEELRALGVLGYALLQPMKARSKYENSKWCVVVDPTDMSKTRFVPELHLRATAKYGKLELHHLPAWTPEGVQVFTRAGSGLDEPIRRQNTIGVPAGTNEYAKQWRRKNRDRVSESNKKYYQKQKQVLLAARRVNETAGTEEHGAARSEFERLISDLKNP